MKLLVAIVSRRDRRVLREALLERGFRFTELASTGGFLGADSATIVAGVEDHEVEDLLGLIRTHCEPRDEVVSVSSAHTGLYADPVGTPMTVRVGGATVFVLNVESVVHV